jgi:uncharacterized RDD family membrane protein YckC
LGAWLIDMVLLAAVQTALGFGILMISSDPGVIGEVIPVGAAVAWAYFALMESSPAQATLGKIAFEIRVTDLSGGPISFRRASARYWLKLLSTLVFGIGWLLAAVTPHRQALHDLLAGTHVVRAQAPRRGTAHWDPTVPALRRYWDGHAWRDGNE